MDPTRAIRGVTTAVSVLTADNPGPMTLDGTNTYLIGAADDLIVVDPGPDLPEHLEVLAAEGRVELILITHRHSDHSAGAFRLATLTGAPVRAADPAYCSGGGAVLRDDELLQVGELDLRVLATPGHTDDSVCFHLGADGGPGAVLTGDTILGRGSTVITHPEGSLGDYLASLDRLAALGPALVLPAHGPQLPDLAIVCARYLEHRLQRLDSVRAALLVLGSDALNDRITDLVYAGIDDSVRPAALQSVAAQVAYLRRFR